MRSNSTWEHTALPFSFSLTFPLPHHLRLSGARGFYCFVFYVRNLCKSGVVMRETIFNYRRNGSEGNENLFLILKFGNLQTITVKWNSNTYNYRNISSITLYFKVPSIIKSTYVNPVIDSGYPFTDCFREPTILTASYNDPKSNQWIKLSWSDRRIVLECVHNDWKFHRTLHQRLKAMSNRNQSDFLKFT